MGFTLLICLLFMAIRNVEGNSLHIDFFFQISKLRLIIALIILHLLYK